MNKKTSTVGRSPIAKPVNTQVMEAPNYDGAELRPYQGRPDANQALALPSRMGNELRYRDGKVTLA